MTPEEREMLIELADKIAATPAPAHDPEADEFIRTNIGKRPDALYILTQTTLIQNLAIQHAHQEIQELKQRLAQPVAAQPASSFGQRRNTGGIAPCRCTRIFAVVLTRAYVAANSPERSTCRREAELLAERGADRGRSCGGSLCF